MFVRYYTYNIAKSQLFGRFFSTHFFLILRLILVTTLRSTYTMYHLPICTCLSVARGKARLASSRPYNMDGRTAGKSTAEQGRHVSRTNVYGALEHICCQHEGGREGGREADPGEGDIPAQRQR